MLAAVVATAAGQSDRMVRYIQNEERDGSDESCKGAFVLGEEMTGRDHSPGAAASAGSAVIGPEIESRRYQNPFGDVAALEQSWRTGRRT